MNNLLVQQNDFVIVGFPRVGQTYLRFLLANIFFPNVEHDFDTIHKLIPALHSKEMLNYERVSPQIFKSHGKTYYKNTIHLCRHVGDVLVSFYHFNRKFYNESRTFEEYVETDKYGGDWRKYVRHWSELAKYQLKYEDMLDHETCMNKLHPIIGDICEQNEIDFTIGTHVNMIKAIKKSQFHNVQKIEKEKGLSELYQGSNPGILFVRSGEIGQWRKEFLPYMQEKLLNYNKYELNILGY